MNFAEPIDGDPLINMGRPVTNSKPIELVHLDGGLTVNPTLHLSTP